MSDLTVKCMPVTTFHSLLQYKLLKIHCRVRYLEEKKSCMRATLPNFPQNSNPMFWRRALTGSKHHHRRYSANTRSAPHQASVERWRCNFPLFLPKKKISRNSPNWRKVHSRECRSADLPRWQYWDCNVCFVCLLPSIFFLFLSKKAMYRAALIVKFCLLQN